MTYLNNHNTIVNKSRDSSSTKFPQYNFPPRVYSSGMHGRGSQASVPASNAAGRGDAAGMPQTARPCRVGPRRATWQVPNRADAAEIGADAAQIRPTRSVSAETAESGQNLKKKKKKVQTHRLTNLNNPDPSQTLTLRPKLPKILSHSVPHLSSLCFKLFVSAVCTLHCFSLQVCSLCSFLEFLFFVFYNFSLSNCLEMNL